MTTKQKPLTETHTTIQIGGYYGATFLVPNKLVAAAVALFARQDVFRVETNGYTGIEGDDEKWMNFRVIKPMGACVINPDDSYRHPIVLEADFEAQRDAAHDARKAKREREERAERELAEIESMERLARELDTVADDVKNFEAEA